MIRFKKKYQNARFNVGGQVIALVVLSVCAGGVAAIPDLSFSGRWRMDTTSIKGNDKPTVFKMVDRDFKRDNNAFVKADGHFHHITGDGYVDEQSISIESDYAIKEVDRIRGKLAYTVEYIVSPDGNTLTWHVASYTSPDGQAVTSETVQRRVGLVTKGTHLISGRWKRVSVTVGPKSDWILKLDGNHFSWRTEGGGGYNAIIGGQSVKLDGDNSGVRVLITRPKPDIIVETDLSAQGKVDDILSMQLMPDSKTIRCTGFYAHKNMSTTFYMHKQANNSYIR